MPGSTGGSGSPASIPPGGPATSTSAPLTRTILRSNRESTGGTAGEPSGAPGGGGTSGSSSSATVASHPSRSSRSMAPPTAHSAPCSSAPAAACGVTCASSSPLDPPPALSSSAGDGGRSACSASRSAAFRYVSTAPVTPATSEPRGRVVRRAAGSAASIAVGVASSKPSPPLISDACQRSTVLATCVSSTSGTAGWKHTTPPEKSRRGVSAAADEISSTTAPPLGRLVCSPFSSVSVPFSISVDNPADSANSPTMGPSRCTQQQLYPRGSGCFRMYGRAPSAHSSPTAWYPPSSRPGFMAPGKMVRT
mmetsp:Transcript_36529/g.90138  ORF Transcript_36529/g.90138 Transcript_36529/m.90138 type:complete len:308 (-) Transcript_36529:169-1092(-)